MKFDELLLELKFDELLLEPKLIFAIYIHMQCTTNSPLYTLLKGIRGAHDFNDIMQIIMMISIVKQSIGDLKCIRKYKNKYSYTN